MKAIELIAEAVSSGARKGKACEALDITLRTLQRWGKPGGLQDSRKSAVKEPVNKLSNEERQEIIEICNRPEYASLPASQIVPAMADKGEYIASESTFYRVLREEGQVNHRGRASAPKNVRKPRGCKATVPNQVWSWDITYLSTTIKGVFFYLYLIMDIYSRKIVGWEIHENESSAHAAALFHKAHLAEGIAGEEIILHSDNGSPMKGASMLGMLQKLGVVPSFSRPSVSNDNPFSESLFRTMKYRPEYPAEPFDTVAEAREWVLQFARWYNHEHKHSALKFITPNERHTGKDKTIMASRKKTYEAAKAKHPERWSGDTRNWDLPVEVWLNSPREENTASGRVTIKAA